MSESNIAAALRYLLSIDCMERTINALKGDFSREIASNRSIGRIHNIVDLLKVLQKRDLITINNLDIIARKLPCNINQHYNDIKHQRVIEPIGQGEAPQAMPNHLQDMPDNLRERMPMKPSPALNQYRIHKSNLETVYFIICDEMGPNHWKIMARKLEIKEEVIDSLSLDHRKTSECIREVLHMHEKKSHPVFWRQDLLHAIDEAKRVDVRMKVEKKLDEYNIIYPQ